MNIFFVLPRINKSAPVFLVRDISNYIFENHPHYNVKVIYLKGSQSDEGFKCSVEKVDFFSKGVFTDGDVVHSHCFSADAYVFFQSLINNSKVKFYSTIHQYNYESFLFDGRSKLSAYMLSTLWNIFLLRHDKIITLSKHMLKYYTERLFNKKIDFVYNSRVIKEVDVNFKDLYLENNLPKDLLILGCASRLTKLKRIDLVIDALKSLPFCGLVILGDGPEISNLKLLVRKENLSDRVFFKGYVDNPQDYFKYFDFFVLSSDVEGFPLSLIEACLSKVPVISSDLDIVCELFSNNEIVTFKKGDSKSLVHSFSTALESNNYSVQKSFDLINDVCSIGKTVSKYIDLYIT